MFTDKFKRELSFVVFAFGMFGGLFGCGLWAKGMFTAGANDTAPELLALTFALATPLPACVLALWHRAIAGWWLIFSGLFLPLGLLYQSAHGPQGSSVSRDLLTSLPITCPLIALGLFSIFRERWKWPDPMKDAGEVKGT